MKGEVKKLKFNPLTLDSILVKDGLEAISTLTNKEPYCVVGGVATQSYLPTLCRRPTSDIDLLIVKPLNYEEFKELSKPVTECLSDLGYSFQFKKRSRAFHLDVENKEGDRLLIEFSRRNKKSFENSRKILERELDNSKLKIVETKGSTYVVLSAEDIIIPKIVRGVGSLIRHPYLEEYLPKQNLSEVYIKERLEFIKELREEAELLAGDLERAEELRFISDVYDVRILSEIIGINKKYFEKSVEDWKTFEDHPKEKRLLFDFLLPKFDLYKILY